MCVYDCRSNAYSSEKIHKYPLFSHLHRIYLFADVCAVSPVEPKKLNAIDLCLREKPFNLKCKSCDLCASVLLLYGVGFIRI